MPKRRRQAAGSARWGWLLLAVFLILLLVSLGLRHGDRLAGLMAGSGGTESASSGGEAAAARDSVPSSEASVPAAPLATRLLRLQILNATGLNDLALQTGEALRAWDVDALDRGNAPAWPFPETLLIVRSGREKEVAQLAQRLGGVPVIVQRREDLMLDATLVLGHDWEDYRWPPP